MQIITFTILLFSLFTLLYTAYKINSTYAELLSLLKNSLSTEVFNNISECSITSIFKISVLTSMDVLKNINYRHYKRKFMIYIILMSISAIFTIISAISFIIISYNNL